MSRYNPKHRLTIENKPCPKHGVHYMRYNFRSHWFVCQGPGSPCGIRVKG